MHWLDRIPTFPLITAAVILGLAPIIPEPHLLEKIRMLVQGKLNRTVDIADLFFHLFPLILLLLQLAYKKSVKQNPMQ